MDDTVRKLLVQMKDCQIVNDNCCEEEFFNIIYGDDHDKCLDILQWLLSQFSEDYANDVKNSQDVEKELAGKLHELHIISQHNKLPLIMKSVSLEEKKSIYEKLFRALHCALFVEKPKEKYVETMFSLRVPENETNENKKNEDAIPVKWVKKKMPQYVKGFDIDRAFEALEDAKKILEPQPMSNKEESSCEPESQLPLEQHFLTDADIVELSNITEDFKDKFRQMMPSRFRKTTVCKSTSAKFNSSVEELNKELHKSLQTLSEATKNSAPEGFRITRVVDSEKTLENINKFKNNSKISKLKPKFYQSR